MQRYKCIISYDGTHYVGWQNQPSGISIQQVLEETLEKLLGHKVDLVGASRTDSGVHAFGQTAHFSTPKDIPLARFTYAINTILPRDIRILSIEAVSETFHAQYSAQSKLYHYQLYTGRQDDPFSHLYHYHFPYPLSIPLLQEAAHIFIGCHDFTSFANCGSSAKTFERTIYRFDLREIAEGHFQFACEGDGFLYKMVRNMVGAIIDVGRGKISLTHLREILLCKDRTKASPPAPARGLFLMKVNYSNTSFKEGKQ